MSDRQRYQSLMDTHKSSTQVANKLGLYGGLMQAGIIGVACSWKHVFTSYYEIAFPILIFLSLYFLVKDFATLLRIEKNLIRMVTEGVEAEKKKPDLGKFFHDTLENFNLMRTLTQRSIINVLTFFGLSYLIYQFLSDINPDFEIHYVLLSLFSVAFSALVAKIYYDALKVLAMTQAQVFSK